jgi:hypothetical protein
VEQHTIVVAVAARSLEAHQNFVVGLGLEEDEHWVARLWVDGEQEKTLEVERGQEGRRLDAKDRLERHSWGIEEEQEKTFGLEEDEGHQRDAKGLVERPWGGVERQKALLGARERSFHQEDE